LQIGFSCPHLTSVTRSGAAAPMHPRAVLPRLHCI